MGILLSPFGAGEDVGIVAEPVPSAASTPMANTSPRAVVELRALEEGRRVIDALERAGYVVGEEGDLRILDATAEGAQGYLAAAYALIVHPRAALLDLDLATAEALLSGRTPEDIREALGGDVRLMASADSIGWLDAAYPVANRFVQAGTAQEVRAAVAANPLLVGVVAVGDLDLTVRALTVEGYDPYRDPDIENPLSDRRWITGDRAGDVAALLGWDTGDDPVGILGAGEMIPARCVTERAASDPRGYDAIYEDSRRLITAADLAIFNWEPSVVDAEPTPCTPTFNMSTSPAVAKAAARAGADVALVIGNHTGDCWTGCPYTEAILQTLQHLRAAGMRTAGAGEDLASARVPAVEDVAGTSVAVLGYDEVSAQHYGAREDTPGTSPISLDAIEADVRAAAQAAEIVVVGFSWGVEYTARPTTYQREAARVAVEAGADLVLGNHPHWVQATEAGDATFIAYGLGNFIFDQDWSIETTQGAIIEAGFRDGRLIGVRLRPTAIRGQLETVVLDPAEDEGRAILQQIWDATDALD